MTQTEALRLALEVLEELENTNSYWWQEVDEATTKKIDPDITAIKAALEANDEPVAWMVYTQEGQSAFVTDNPAVIHPSQRALPLYATPQRTWVNLTLTEMELLFIQNTTPKSTAIDFARAIEAKLKEKNHA
jgi:hypothetical protein